MDLQVFKPFFVEYYSEIIMFGFTGLIIMFICGFIMKIIEVSFLPKFEKLYHLTDVSCKPVKPTAKEIRIKKVQILYVLARHYLAPYWTPFRRKYNNYLLKKYEEEKDEYFFACRYMLDDNYPIKDIKEMDKWNKLEIFEGLCIEEKDLRVFLVLERCMMIGLLVLLLGLPFALMIKFVFPELRLRNR